MNRGRRESGVRAAPAVSCAKMHKKTHTSIQVQRRQSGFPCAVVYGLFRALPGDRAFLPPSSPRSLLLKNLTPASGRQDHTASPSATTAFVIRRLRVHRISPRVRDDRDPPLSSGETRGAKALICPMGEAEICPSGCVVAARVSRFRSRARPCTRVPYAVSLWDGLSD